MEEQPKLSAKSVKISVSWQVNSPPKAKKLRANFSDFEVFRSKLQLPKIKEQYQNLKFRQPFSVPTLIR